MIFSSSAERHNPTQGTWDGRIVTFGSLAKIWTIQNY